MSFVAFARGLFRDSQSIVNVAEKAGSTGKRPDNSEINLFATTIKRAKQTVEDWELFASLQDSASEEKVAQIKSVTNTLFQTSVLAVKSPSPAALSTVKEKFTTFCNTLATVVGEENISEIEGLEEHIKKTVCQPAVPSPSTNSDHTQTSHTQKETNSKISPAQITPELLKQLKSLAMKALVDLKELSGIVITSIRTRESTALHFAHAARSTFQTSHQLATFAKERGYEKEAQALMDVVDLFIAHSKEIFIKPVPIGEQQEIVAAQLEKEKTAIAIHIRDTLNLISTSQNKNSSPAVQAPVSNSPPAVQAPPPVESNDDEGKQGTKEPIQEPEPESEPDPDPEPLQRPKEKLNSSLGNEAKDTEKESKDIKETKEIIEPQEGKSELSPEKVEEKRQKRIKDRNHAFQEIISSEKIYFSNLQFVYWSIITTLEEETKKNEPIISATELRNMFSNWQSLMTFNKELLKALEKRKNIPLEERLVGDTFLELVSLMKMYTDYVNNFDISNRIAAECLDRPEFAELIQKCLSDAPTPGLTLASYLIMPVQRLPRYEMLLRALWKLTDEHHPDFENLERACKQVKQINDHVNLKKKEAENREIVYGIQEKLLGISNLIQAHRLFIREGELQFSPFANPKKTKKREPFYFYLFNDILLKCKFNKKKLLHEVKESFALTEYSIRDVTYSPFMSSTERFCFRLVLQRDERTGVTFFAQNAEEKAEWYVDLETAIRNQDQADSTLVRR